MENKESESVVNFSGEGKDGGSVQGKSPKLKIGGKTAGAGRKRGSTRIEKNRLRFVRQCIDEGLDQEAIRVLKRKMGKNILEAATFVLKQIIGEAPRQTQVQGDSKKPLKLELYLPKKGSLKKLKEE